MGFPELYSKTVYSRCVCQNETPRLNFQLSSFVISLPTGTPIMTTLIHTLSVCLLISAFPKTCFLVSLSPFIQTIPVTLSNSLETCPFLPVHSHTCACVLNCFSCLAVCDAVGCSPPGSSVYGVLQGRILEWVSLPSSGDLPDLGVEPVSLTSPALAGGFFATSATQEATFKHTQTVTHEGCHCFSATVCFTKGASHYIQFSATCLAP